MSIETVESLIKYFFVLFVVVEPVSLVPMFGALTRGSTDSFRRKMAGKSCIIALLILISFTLVGDFLLNMLGVSVEAFKVAGGLLLSLLAVDMVFARNSGLRSATVREQDEARYREDVSVFPMAFPLIAGPGALATLLLITGEVKQDSYMFLGLLGILLAIIAITYLLLRFTTQVMKVLGVTGANVISRLAGVVLVALAVQYIADGVIGLWLSI